MSDMNVTSSGKGPRRWVGPALLASLAINIFLVGLISVPLFFQPHDRGFGPPPKGHGPMMMHNAFRELPEEDRLAFRRAMREKFYKVIPFIRDSQEARDALADAIAADPYDEAAVRAAFDDIEKAMISMGEAGRDAMLEVFAKLSPEQRQRVADAMREEQERIQERWEERRATGGRPELGDRQPPGERGPEVP